MNTEDIVIIAAKRTPTGGMLGKLSALSTPELAAFAIKASIAQANIKANEINEVIMGCVLPAGIGQAPARQAAIKAGIPTAVPATTLNKMCGSGLKSVMLGHDLIKAGSAEIVLAGGMESMSNAPYLLLKARTGYRLGHGELKDHMFLDGLEDAYDRGKLMGCFSDQTAEHYHFTREQQDEYALRSGKRAIKARQDNLFDEEIAPVTISERQGELTVNQDEIPDENKLAKMSKLKPAFKSNGTATAANSSSISDGAASIILMTAANAQKRGIKPLAKIIAHASHAQEPQWFTTAPVGAIKKVLAKAGWTENDVDFFEINEAFSTVVLAAIAMATASPPPIHREATPRFFL